MCSIWVLAKIASEKVSLSGLRLEKAKTGTGANVYIEGTTIPTLPAKARLAHLLLNLARSGLGFLLQVCAHSLARTHTHQHTRFPRMAIFM